MKKIKVGIIGCGTIGTEIALACRKDFKSKTEVVCLSDKDSTRVEILKRRLGNKPRSCGIDELIAKSDLVIEAATSAIVKTVVSECLKKRKDAMIMSVGGLFGQRAFMRSIEFSRSRVYLPSGAICGLDGIKAASLASIHSIRLTTRKPPASLKGAPYIIEKKIDLNDIKEETVIFEGTAGEAVKAFPQNINVASLLGLASGRERIVHVRIITSPLFTTNIHEVEVESDCGTILTKTENVPSKHNPKTSRLAVLSAIATLRGIVSRVRIGT